MVKASLTTLVLRREEPLTWFALIRPVSRVIHPTFHGLLPNAKSPTFTSFHSARVHFHRLWCFKRTSQHFYINVEGVPLVTSTLEVIRTEPTGQHVFTFFYCRTDTDGTLTFETSLAVVF